ncbi:TerD family protein [Streptomyces sp. NRRL F-5727]|uniref:TerD family protein n=1 Tax=Streptomyces sp. NRRL F-5727 TaxID=1463871 RepID=UPI00068D42A9|nr:TerD family protein [Streptomyces sp. NRRL F-5727]
MTQIIKGGNLPAPGQGWKVTVVRGASGSGVPEVEAAALLLDAAGRVTDDGDLLFRDRRAHASGAVRLIGQVRSEGRRRVADWLEIDTARMDPGVQRIVIAAAVDEGTFGQVPGLSVQAVGAGTGEQFALYEIEGATTETAFVLGEFYRRDGGWRFRAVGQGYASGLAGLAKDFGVAGGPPAAVSGPGPVLLAGVAKVPASEAPAPVSERPVQPPAVPARLPAPPAETEAPEPPAPASETQAAEPPAPASETQAPEPPAQASKPRTPKAPARSPARGSARHLAKARPPVRADREPSPAAALFGEDFPEFVREGSGTLEFIVDEPLPTGFFVVDTERSGDGSFMVEAVDDTKPGLDLIAHTRLEDSRTRTLVRHNDSRPLRLRVHGGDSAWKLTFRPVSVVEELGLGATGRGRDVLLHTGPAAELSARLRPEVEHPYFEVGCYTPRARGVWDADLLVSETHKRTEYRVSLPAGPVLVRLSDAEGDWSLEVRPTP